MLRVRFPTIARAIAGKPDDCESNRGYLSKIAGVGP